MAERETSVTGYLILGILCSGDRSAYDLAEQLGKGLAELWPSADRGRYSVLTRLEGAGLVAGRRESTGKRPRTVYSITPAGHEALAAWLATPVKAPALEFEAMVRVLVSDEGTIDDMRRTLAQTREQALANREMFVRYAAFITETGGTFPERSHLFALSNTFMIGHYDHIVAWVDWAEKVIETWPDTTSTDVAAAAWAAVPPTGSAARP